MDLLIATKNPGKLSEISRFLKLDGINLKSLRDFPEIAAPAENGLTFRENALIKAKYFAEKFGLTTLADDGGFEIEVFSGAPGVKSRRWLDGVHEATDEELIAYCLKKMKGIKDRRAKLTACVCLYFVNDDYPASCRPKIFYSQESISGIIAEKPAAKVFPGFPFRSLLWVPRLKKFYNEDEFTEEETVRYNHRYRAIAKIKNQLIKYV